MSTSQRVMLLLIIFALIGISFAANKLTCGRYFERQIGTADPGCVEICHRECTNGTCDQHGACICSRGFTNVQRAHYQCQQICPAIDFPENSAYCVTKCRAHDGCIHGTCDSLGGCTCNDRFINNKRNFLLCEPICEPQCRNGHCDSSLKCVCKRDYQIIEPYGNCGKLCTSNDFCGNGQCSENGTCYCNAGFVNDGTNACVPMLMIPSCKTGHVLVNGTCEVKCSKDQDCSTEGERCSPEGICKRLSIDCKKRCELECHQRCGEGNCEDVGGALSCTEDCVQEKCNNGGDISDTDFLFDDERSWVIFVGISVVILVVVLAIVLAVVVLIKRRRARDESHTPMTDLTYRELVENRQEDRHSTAGGRDNEAVRSSSPDNFKHGDKDGAWGAQPQRSQNQDNDYMTPRNFKVEHRYADTQSSSKEGTASGVQNMFTQGNPDKGESYLNMEDLSQGGEADPVYLNVVLEQDDCIYENFTERT